MSLLLSFDIGHSSIGWGVLDSTRLGQSPVIKGCGSVIFPADDCLASKRRNHRRTRRNIRATRHRILRIKQLLSHLDVLEEADLDAVGHPAPHVLAARVLINKQPLLSWFEMWSVIRWYAHNRGYDGNSRWARHESKGDETDKELAALDLMKKHGTEGRSMAETICATLGIDPCSNKISSEKPFKTINAAFPRKIVRREVIDILNIHKDVLPCLNADFINTLIAQDGDRGHRAWETIKVPEIKLPRRYYGGLLFGQLIPRFDNRIIARCPISGEKVPNKATSEFLNYRWAMILANLRSDGQPLPVKLRNTLHSVMLDKGRLTATELRKEIEAVSGSKTNNVKGYFELHPDAAEALVLDPALVLYNGEGAGSKSLKPYWDCLPENVRKRAKGRWKKRRIVDLNWMLSQCESDEHGVGALKVAIDAAFDADQKKNKPQYLTYEHFLNQSFSPTGLSGRAPYSRKVMQDAVDFVLSTNRHPTESGTDELQEGPLYRSKVVKAAERKVSLPQLTNNHLIRQRLDILLRLVDDILAEYADSDISRVSDVVIEVASDLQTYSGLSAKEMQGELTKRLSHFKSAVTLLEKEAPDLPLTGSLIRKCRIAMDLNWKCPFTGDDLYPRQLSQYEIEHIIPYAVRPTNALDALVLTYPWVNRLKGKRTAMAFINDVAEDQRFLTPKNYIDAVKRLKVANRDTYPEDSCRQSKRQSLLVLEHYETREHGFTPGALTQTSHLNRLSVSQIEKRFIDPISNEPMVRVHSIPGQVTAETRKSWRMLGTLAQACPQILDENNKPKSKTDIRGITHLHHALDAVVLGLTHAYLPGSLPGQIENEKGAIWRAMLRRNKTSDEQNLLLSSGMFTKHYRKNKDGSIELDDKGQKKLDVHLNDIPKDVKQQVAIRLAERRVVQHIPADQSDYDFEETTWRYVCDYKGQALLLQRIGRDSLKEDSSKTTFGWMDVLLKGKALQNIEDILNDEVVKEIITSEGINVNLIRRGIIKLAIEPHRSIVGLNDGKLKQLKAVRVISHNANYGLALTSKPKIIPFHDVSRQIRSLTLGNRGKKPLILRNGMILRIKGISGREGLWRIVSCQSSLKLDLVPVECVSNRSVNWREVNIHTLIKRDAYEVLAQRYTGAVG